jgi:hypothetical protein
MKTLIEHGACYDGNGLPDAVQTGIGQTECVGKRECMFKIARGVRGEIRGCLAPEVILQIEEEFNQKI